MLRNRNVRTKLVAILLAPVVTLVLLAGAGVWDRWQLADGSRSVRELAMLSSEFMPLVHALQDERGLTVAISSGLAGDGFEPADLAAARTTTDAAVQRFTSAVSAIDLTGRDPDLVDALDRVSNQMDRLANVRGGIDAGSSGADAATYFFSQGVVELLTASGHIGGESTSTGLLTAAAVATTWAQYVETNALERDLLTRQFVVGAWTPETFTRFVTLDDRAARDRSRFADLAGEQDDDAAQAVMSQTAILQTESVRYALLLAGGGGPLVRDPAAWYGAMSQRLALQRAFGTQLVDQVLVQADVTRSDAEDAVVLFAGLALGAIILAVLGASVVARSIVKPLKALTANAYVVSQEQLPQLVERLRSPGSVTSATAGLAPIEVTSTDELGRLAEAFNSIQTTAVQVATEQAVLLRKGIGEMFVNLARRNQSLLDRQISYLDELEATEEDADRLEELFKLDHLATRMRRNAESLLVLAGLEPARRWGKPVDLDEVVRAAVAEVEDYDRVDVTVLDRSSVLGHAAVDVAHLLSELLENATRMSPPTSPVLVSGRRGDRAYLLTVVDHGMGMTDDAIAEANDLFANPPVVGLALSKSLGFIVIGRLAARFGIGVTIAATPGGGVTATVALPNEIVAEPDGPVTVAAPPALAVLGDGDGDGVPGAPGAPVWHERALDAGDPGVGDDLDAGPPVPAGAGLATSPLPSRRPAAAADVPPTVDLHPTVPMPVPVPPAPTVAPQPLAVVPPPPALAPPLAPPRGPVVAAGPPPAAVPEAAPAAEAVATVPDPSALVAPASATPVPPAVVSPLPAGEPAAALAKAVATVPAPPSFGDDEAPFQPRFVSPAGEGDADPERTAAGLVRRRAGATAEQAPARPPLAQRESSGEGRRRTTDGEGGEGRRRSPDEMRNMLARYRSGQERGRLGGPADRAPARTRPGATTPADRGPHRTEDWRDPR